MLDVEQMAADGPAFDVQSIPVAAVDYEEGNPNEMSAAAMEALRSDIRENGFIQPVVVRRDGDRFRMVDGQHRHEIVAELGYATIPAVVIEADDDEGVMRLLTTNKLRGEFVPVKFALMLADLAERIPEEEITRRLGMETAEMRDALKLADFTDDVGEVLREQVERERATAPQQLRFVVTARDADLIERVVGAVAADGKDRGKALAEVCRFYEQQHKSKEKT